MRFKGSRQSTNIEDRTGSSGGRKAAAGGGIGVVIIALIALFFGGGNLDLGGLLGASQTASYQTENVTKGQYEEQKEFAAVVFAHLEDYWGAVFEERSEAYSDPTLVLFTDSVSSACGQADAQVGPFYCPADEKVYIDLSFSNELSSRYGATGDFAMAYVIAHEVGHHIQNTLGITEQLDTLRGKISETEYNKYSVRLELQADYLAGCFAKYLQGESYNGQPILETGDIEEAITAANAIGDDTLQKEFQGYVVPDSFTHGTSEQRVAWFQRGVRYGDLEHGDTFSAADLDL